jgi:hypothetical protein
MSSKPLEGYTDKDLETAIQLHEAELRKDKYIFVTKKQSLSTTEIQQLQKSIILKEEW